MAGEYLTIITILFRKYEFWNGAARGRKEIGCWVYSRSMHLANNYFLVESTINALQKGNIFPLVGDPIKMALIDSRKNGVQKDAKRGERSRKYSSEHKKDSLE